MSKAAVISNLTKDPLKLAIGVALVIGVVYFLGRKTVKDTADFVEDTAGGIFTGNNAITKDTVYEGKGVLGTLGGAANRTFPFLEDWGEWIGGTLYDWFNPNAGK